MKFPPVSPAELVFDADGTPTAPAFGDVYHARAGALEQAREVFLAGNGLPDRWDGCEHFVVLETGFGLGQNFLATWAAWRQHHPIAATAAPERADVKTPAAPDKPAPRLWFVSIEKHPVPRDLAEQALSVHQGTPLEPFAQALLAAWPAVSPDIFRAAFDDGHVMLQVVHAEVALALRELRLQANALFLDGFSPRRNEDMWSPALFKALPRLLAPGCTAATWSAARAVRNGLEEAGFDVRLVDGFGGKRQRLTASLAHPRHAKGKGAAGGWPAPHPLPVWQASEGPVLIIGAGLAGAACAQALASAGVPSMVLDAADEPAQGASGNPAGLFHGVVHPEDGAHARLGRAAAWMAQQAYAPLVAAGHLPGGVDGLLRREVQVDTAAMQALLQRLGLPPEYVQPVEADEVQRLLGTPVPTRHPAWYYPGGGWIDPGAWVRQALSHPLVHFRGGCPVTRIQREGLQWSVIGPDGTVYAQATRLVLCQAAAIMSLLPSRIQDEWPVGRQRGQITRVPRDMLPATPPMRPLSGGGYALTLPNGDVLCGATTTRDDPEACLREADHLENLHKLRGLMGWSITPELPALQGRVGWRFQTADRLPIVGPIGAFADHKDGVAGHKPPRTRLREFPCEPGLYAATALGSRGLTWAPMAGAVIASWIGGEPAPLPASLMDALDPRRFAVKRARRPTGD